MNSILYKSINPIIEYNLSIREEILEICAPLFSNYGITYFEYGQIFNDGKIFYVCSNKEWLQFSLENKMFDDEEHIRFCSIAKAYNYRYALWNTLKLEDTKLLSQYFQHDVWNGLTINENEEGSFNTYSFATTRNNITLNNFFLNNLYLFDHFIIYFKQKIKHIFDKNIKNLAFAASALRDINDLDKIGESNDKINAFLEQTALKNFEITVDNKVICLTKRELECLHILSTGKTSKEAANKLELSQRTVESHVNSIKSKTGFVFKNELISFFEKSSLKNYKHLSLK